jgi:hypothetical protein
MREGGREIGFVYGLGHLLDGRLRDCGRRSRIPVVHCTCGIGGCVCAHGRRLVVWRVCVGLRTLRRFGRSVLKLRRHLDSGLGGGLWRGRKRILGEVLIAEMLFNEWDREMGV